MTNKKSKTTVSLTATDLYYIFEWVGRAVPSGEDEMDREEAKVYRKLSHAQDRVHRKAYSQ